MSDLDKISQVAASKDEGAFRQLFEKFAPRIKAYMIKQGVDSATAEELAQETLTKVWKKAELYSGAKGSVASWIFTVARNLRIDRLRKEQTWIDLPESYDELASEDALPDEVVSKSELQLRMKCALDSLPEDQRVAVVLSYVEGLSHREIADRLVLPLGTIKSRIRLAYLKLRAAVEVSE